MQRVFSGTLATILDVVEKDKPIPPTLIIVGEVVRLREKLNWFQTPAEPHQGATAAIAPPS